MKTGEMIVGKYKLVSTLGKGGAGEVHLVQDPLTDKRLALKVLHKNLAEDETQQKRFMREAQNTSCLNHENILHVDEVGEYDGQMFIAMEYVKGLDMAEVVKKVKSLPLLAVLTVATRLTQALRCSHDAGIVHRDIKPHNVFVGLDGRIKLGDFGLARRSDGSDMVTMARGPLGSPAYMSPEQIMAEDLDIRSDIYSFGATLYHALVGHPPFHGLGNVTEIMKAQVQDPMPPLPQDIVDACPPFAALIEKMMAKDPKDRPQTPDELALELEACQRYLWEHPLASERKGKPQMETPKLRLQVVGPDGAAEMKEIEIQASMMIGRNPSVPICLTDGYVSRSGHATIEVKEGDLVIVPQPGKEVTLNGETVSPAGAPLQVGDEFVVGHTRITVQPEAAGTDSELDRVVDTLADEFKDIDFAWLAQKKRERKEQLLTAAQERYDANRPWAGKLLKVFKSDSVGTATIMAQEFLLEQGFSKEESSRLVEEMKGKDSDHLQPGEVQEAKDFCGLPIQEGEVSLVVPLEAYRKKLKGYTWGDIFRYRGQDWYPVKRRETEDKVFLYLKRCADA